MDRQEGYNPSGTKGYAKATVPITTYDGRTLEAFIYTGRNPKPETPCSQRYLDILIKVIRITVLTTNSNLGPS